MAQKSSGKKPAQKRSSKGLGPLLTAGSPITIGGGGSVWIDFLKESDYPNQTTGPDDNDGPASSQIGTLLITDNSGRTLDLAPLLPTDRRQCKIKIHGQNANETITIKGGKPFGINFKKNVYPKGQNTTWPNRYYCTTAEISKIEFRYPGFGVITFESPNVGICSVKVDRA